MISLFGRHRRAARWAWLSAILTVCSLVWLVPGSAPGAYAATATKTICAPGGSSATATSYYSSSVPDNAIDCNTSTSWTVPGGSGTITITLGAPEDLYGLSLLVSASPTSTNTYQVNAMVGGAWQQVGSATATVGSTSTVPVTLTTPGVYSEIQIVAYSNMSWIGMFEAYLVVATTPLHTQNLVLTGGSLSVGGFQPPQLGGSIGSDIIGDLASATWSDTTGTGAGWHGTIQVGCQTYTGTWYGVGSVPALTDVNSAPYTGDQDGVRYTLTVTGPASGGSVPFSYVSSVSADPSGSGTATIGVASTVGTQGLTITLPSGTYASGDTYKIEVGTQDPAAITVDKSAPGAGVSQATGTGIGPALVNDASTIQAPTTCGSMGAAITVVDAATGTGMGSFSVVPGVQIAIDSNSWVGTYAGPVQYSIVAGP